MKDLSKGTVSIKGFSFEVTTVRPEPYLGILPQPKEFVPPMVTTTRCVKLEEHKIDFENNLDLSPDEVHSTNKVVSEMLKDLIMAGSQVMFAANADSVARRQHEKDMAILTDDLDAKKHARIHASRQ